MKMKILACSVLVVLSAATFADDTMTAVGSVGEPLPNRIWPGTLTQMGTSNKAPFTIATDANGHFVVPAQYDGWFLTCNTGAACASYVNDGRAIIVS